MGLHEKISCIRDWIEKIRDSSVNYRIFFSGVSVGAATLMVQAVQTFKEIIVADKFGTGIDLENFIIAFLIPGFLIAVIADSIPSALLPIFEQIREDVGDQNAKGFLGFIFLLLVILSLLACVLLFITSNGLLYPIISHFSMYRQHLIVSFNNVMLLAVVAQTGFVCLCTFFFAQKKFFSTAILRIITPLVVVLLLIIDPFEQRVLELVVGTLLGIWLQLTTILFRSVRSSLFSHLVSYHHYIKKFLKQYMPLCLAAAIMGGTTLIDNSMASLLPAKNLASLNFGNKIVMALLSLAGTVLSSSVLPYFSEMSAKKDHDGLIHTVRTYQKLILKISLPGTALLVFFSEPIIRMIWQHGAFTNIDTLIVTKIQWLYSLQIPFYLMGMLLARAISSLSGNHLLSVITISNLFLNFVLNWSLMKIMSVYGIALSTSVVYFLSYMMLEFTFKKMLRYRLVKDR